MMDGGVKLPQMSFEEHCFGPAYLPSPYRASLVQHDG